jgi:hypothetical protein
MDAVKHLVLCQIEKRPPKLDLDVYPYLPKANVFFLAGAVCVFAAADGPLEYGF